VLKKNREHTGNILFIDASNGFEKQKNQNKLLPEHLDNIVAAVENRQDIEKYAHVATLQQVKDNDYNLNIPRYGDTFEAEADMDLDAIAQQLQQLEKDSQKTDAVIADFCKEVEIASPFEEVK
jgi:type I restriction enzyme M protein